MHWPLRMTMLLAYLHVASPNLRPHTLFSGTEPCIPPCPAALLGDVALTTASGTDSRSGTTFDVGENVYGPFEAGFSTQQVTRRETDLSGTLRRTVKSPCPHCPRPYPHGTGFDPPGAWVQRWLAGARGWRDRHLHRGADGRLPVQRHSPACTRWQLHQLDGRVRRPHARVPLPRAAELLVQRERHTLGPGAFTSADIDALYSCIAAMSSLAC